MRRALPILTFAAVALGGCATTAPSTPAAIATGTLARADGSVAGTINITPMAGHMHVHMRVSGFAPGTYGTHLHTTGRCEGPAFASAGGHLNPGGAQHGVYLRGLGGLGGLLAGGGGDHRRTQLPRPRL
jgi:Cu-Zn family superoxide dismutase